MDGTRIPLLALLTVAVAVTPVGSPINFTSMLVNGKPAALRPVVKPCPNSRFLNEAEVLPDSSKLLTSSAAWAVAGRARPPQSASSAAAGQRPGRSGGGRAARRRGARNPPAGRRRMQSEKRDGRPGGAAGGQAAMAGRLAPAPEAQSWPRRSALGARRSALGARRSALGARRSALGARRSALLIRVAQTASNHFAQFVTIAAPLPVRAS